MIFMEPIAGGTNPTSRQRDAAAEIARKKVLAAYSSDAHAVGTFSRSILSDPYKKRAYRNMGYAAGRIISNDNNTYNRPTPVTPAALKQAPISTNVAAAAPAQKAAGEQAVNWQKYHSAWQYYYQKYYSDYYAKAANQLIENERLKHDLKDTRKERDEQVINPDRAVDPTDEEDYFRPQENRQETRIKKRQKVPNPPQIYPYYCWCGSSISDPVLAIQPYDFCPYYGLCFTR